ncbi:KAP family NTPase [Rhodobacteraceae bacterium S2214]|nr:KAP family NTPase [Rhodobacteraceae bacterium S2214]
MPRLNLPKPNIELYKHGFAEAKDQLERVQTGVALSKLVERIEDPMVIALDGGWGTGKSYFLQCWVGQHLKDEEHQAQTVYFDAFEHDFIDSPLASLMGVIAERLEGAENGPSFAKQAVQKIRAAALPLTRLALAVASYGATEAGGALFDAMTKQASKELNKAAADFWARESGTRVAMEQFREALIALTVPALGSDTPQKLVIVVDELDRCRPDYALSLLEIIKHFFDVPHVHFVLGANMRELQNSVSARYGAGIDAALYLQKFVTLTMRLPEHLNGGRGAGVAERYFEQISAKIGLEAGLLRIVREITTWIKEPDVVSLRGFERLASVLAITPAVWHPPRFRGQYDEELSQPLLVLLVMLKTWFPDVFAKARNGTLSVEDIRSEFEIGSFSEEARLDGRYQIIDELDYHLAPDIYDARQSDRRTGRPRVRANTMRDFRYLVIAALDVFEIQ